MIDEQHRDTPILRLQAPVASWHDDRLTITCALGEATTLMVRLRGPRSVLRRVQPRIEPFLPMALLIAGVARADLEVSARVDQTYLSTLRLGYVPMLERLYAFPRTQLRVTDQTDRPAGWSPRRRLRRHGLPEPAMLLFSGGIDSLYSYYRLRQVGHPLTTLVNVNAGAHGPHRELMERRFERVRRFATAAGIEALLIDANFHELLQIPHKHVYPIRNIAAASTLHGAAAGLISSNSRAYDEVSFELVGDYIGNIGPALLSSFAWAGMPHIEVGYEAGRYAKLARVAEEPPSYRMLDVCVDAAYQLAAGPGDVVNCGRCSKCHWVQLALEHMGRLDRFGTQFDLARFASHRQESIDYEAEHAKVGYVAPFDLGQPMPPTVVIEAPSRV